MTAFEEVFSFQEAKNHHLREWGAGVMAPPSSVLPGEPHGQRGLGATGHGSQRVSAAEPLTLSLSNLRIKLRQTTFMPRLSRSV